jgi:predicted nuclease of restriction endonuclease-like (RecB) superfamily
LNFIGRLVANFESSHFCHQAGGKSLSALSASSEILLTQKSNQMPDMLGAIPWRHHVEIVRHAKSVEEAMFYIDKTVKCGWSKEDLIDCLKKDLYRSQGKAITLYA